MKPMHLLTAILAVASVTAELSEVNIGPDGEVDNDINVRKVNEKKRFLSNFQFGGDVSINTLLSDN